MSAPASQPTPATAADHSPWAVFLIFLRLGLTSFGGPIAHLAYFRDEFVNRRRWLSERSYADLVALCQFLPGPASSQVGLALGLSRAGYSGALAAWAGFTLPSAIALIVLAIGIGSQGDALPAGLLQGLKVVAVAVVAQAVWGMGRSLCPDAPRLSLMAVATCVVLAVPGAWTQVGIIVAAGLIGLAAFKPTDDGHHDALTIPVGRAAAVVCLVLFLGLLLGLPLVAAALPDGPLAQIDAFYRAGALVFGGGHVVLPLLQAETVDAGWVGKDVFLAGYGAAQAVPGPLFTFAAFLGAAMTPGGWIGGMVCLLAIFAPAFLLVVACLPFWEALRRSPRVRAALTGINAAVVGLLLAALYDPVWTSAIHRPADFALGLLALVALMAWKVPPWLVVLGCAAGGWLLA
ncbi:chromate efflux transporter [Parazoarcus communis]|uniref:Chromate transporter n=1 Tax=Parazoarcus communis SWub3 = DSM 12120 TaxID=1121029 RepID=A0A323UZP1_9RHOO|nr:chromate efflux transporter [Parazoarcus communis]NMG68820.1 chromate efflux transporter [Parazoarcus communis SWub3 = DSM 12120]PZA17937.1 chromate transporter [Azoarcus communis] [Parazoarcus communis SWub3 = DSM 12120]